MLGAPYGEDTTADDLKNAGCCRCILCCWCVCAGKLLNSLVEESIFMIQEEHGNPKAMLKESDKAVKKMGCCLRPTGIILSILGWSMLFIPTIRLFQWIPLVGKLLGWIVSGIAFLVGLLCGGQLAVLVMSIAWLRFNPLCGFLLLSFVGCCIAALFIVPAYF